MNERKYIIVTDTDYCIRCGKRDKVSDRLNFIEVKFRLQQLEMMNIKVEVFTKVDNEIFK